MATYLRRWAIMVLLVLPATLVTVAAILTWLRPAAVPEERSFAHTLGDIVGFYVGYGLLAGTALSAAHTFTERRRHLDLARSAVLGALLGALVLLPQAVYFGAGFWGSSLLVGAAAGAVFGAIVGFPGDGESGALKSQFRGRG